jgi:hypothetical protein
LVRFTVTLGFMTANATPQATDAAPERQGSTVVLVEGMRVMDTRNGKLADLKAFSAGGGFAYLRNDEGFEWQAPMHLVIPVLP